MSLSVKLCKNRVKSETVKAIMKNLGHDSRDGSDRV